MDLDFVNVAFVKRSRIKEAMESLGFHEEDRYFRHPDTAILIEFPPGPLGVGEEPVKQIIDMETGVGTLRILSPTDCVKDRLSWFYHGGDAECLEQAVLVAQGNEVDLKAIERWSRSEGKGDAFAQIRPRLRKRRAQAGAPRFSTRRVTKASSRSGPVP
jgi:hypothetical protein